MEALGQKLFSCFFQFRYCCPRLWDGPYALLDTDHSSLIAYALRTASLPYLQPQHAGIGQPSAGVGGEVEPHKLHGYAEAQHG